MEQNNILLPITPWWKIQKFLENDQDTLTRHLKEIPLIVNSCDICCNTSRNEEVCKKCRALEWPIKEGME